MASAAAPLLDAETFSASSQRDALGRTIEAISPDGSRTRYAYDQGGGLRQVTLEPRGATPAQTVVGDITYDPKGQRLQVVYGPADSPTTTTDYTYDPQTYRLTRLKTTRGSDNALLQSLHYHYDPAGNITDIRDTAQQTVFFQNTVVEAANSYTYDGVGRLIEATGREHASQGTAQRTHAQLPVGPQPMASDPSAMRRYTQRYTYDPAGNILKLQHIPSSGTGWTRHYAYATDGNRLLATSAPGDPPNGPYSHSYTYDAHGSMVTMPHLPAMTWNLLDQLQHATAGTQEVYFQYAGGSNRSRKFTEHAGGTTEERIYLGPFELYRKRINGQLELERETLHVSDGTGRICMVETKTVDASTPVPSPTPMWRFQLSNHLGSTATEVTETGAVISHEEYHPYGTSAYRAVDSSIDVSARRYRYTGMERDEETGLGYHTARYYVPWLGRWSAPDPIGLVASLNRFFYSSGNPVTHGDPSGTITRQERANAAVVNAERGQFRAQELVAQAAQSGDPQLMQEAEILLHQSTLQLQRAQQHASAVNSAEPQGSSEGGSGSPENTFARALGESIAFVGAVAERLHGRAVDQTVEFLAIVDDQQAYEATIGTGLILAGDALRTKEARRELAHKVWEEAKEAVREGVAGVGEYFDAAVTDDVEGGADAVQKVAVGALILMGGASLMKAGLRRLAGSRLGSALTRRLQASRRAKAIARESSAGAKTGAAGGGAGRTPAGFLPEAQARLQSVRDEFPNVDNSFVGMARKSDLRQIDRIVKEFSLNRSQRRLLHDEISGENLSLDEIRTIAQDIAKYNPKKGRD